MVNQQEEIALVAVFSFCVILTLVIACLLVRSRDTKPVETAKQFLPR